MQGILSRETREKRVDIIGEILVTVACFYRNCKNGQSYCSVHSIKNKKGKCIIRYDVYLGKKEESRMEM